MTNATTDSKIGDIVGEDFRAAAIFQKYGMDFCCGGGQSLSAACAARGVDAGSLIEELASVTAVHDPNMPDFRSWSLDVLITHIVSVHHSYVKRLLPVVQSHVDKVAEVHGANHPETRRIAFLFSEVNAELERHMFKEEQVLFPYITRMARAERGEGEYEGSHFGSVRNPIHMMELEHESAGSALAEIRRLSNGLTPPEDACTTYRVLYKELDEFERDLHQHIHLENNILHPHAIELEQSLIASLQEK